MPYVNGWEAGALVRSVGLTDYHTAAERITAHLNYRATLVGEDGRAYDQGWADGWAAVLAATS